MTVVAKSDVQELWKTLPEFDGRLLLNEPMSLYTSYRIGGPADAFAVVNDEDGLWALLRWAKDTSTPIFILGAGTNILVADKGIRGLVIKLGRNFRGVRIKNEMLIAGAAAHTSTVVRKALGRGMRGLEGLAGIPGAIGGAICMNAGTPAGCIREAIKTVRAMTSDGHIVWLPASKLGLRYRGSDISNLRMVILEAVFKLSLGDHITGDIIVEALLAKRRYTQPPGVRTAGSVFKNPPNEYAGRLLEAVEAKGMQIGGARVSSRHANFIENTGTASAEDVRTLMDSLEQLVFQKFGIKLEREIELVGDW